MAETPTPAVRAESSELPRDALSVRQPWAWAIVAGVKDIENRTTFAVTKGSMSARPVAIHASKSMTRNEYEEAADFMASLGVECPRPDDLIRGAIIGFVDVTAVVKTSDSPWFFGPRGLVLANARQVTPIAAQGALGYFRWRAGGEIGPTLSWMSSWPERPSAARKVEAKVAEQNPALPLFAGQNSTEAANG